MKNEKKGFTLIEVIVCIVLLMVIAGIFTVNFITNLSSTRNRKYDDAVKVLESAADAYVMSIKTDTDPIFDDIKAVMENDKTFSYITLDEMDDNGFLGEKSLENPSTGESFEGVVKFTNDGGVYDFEYLDNPKNLITIRYDRNGADSVARTAQAIICEDEENIDKCVETLTLPNITRVGGRIFGWSTDSNATTSSYKGGTKVSNILKNSNYNIENKKIRLYAVTSAERTVYFETKGENLDTPKELSCTVYNTTSTCSITMPDYVVDEYHEKKGWNTNDVNTGDDYRPGSSILVDKNITLYLSQEVKGFDILVNRLNRISSTTVIPSNINIVFVLDVSGSMSSNNRLSNLKTVSTGLVDRMNFDNSTVSLITFSSSSGTRLRYETDRLRIRSEITRLNAYGGTSFTSAISTANSLLSDIPNDKPSFVIFVSDGISSISSNYSDLLALKNKAEIYTIGLGITADNAYLKTIASKPENFYRYNETLDTASLKEFYQLFDDIVQNIMILEGDGIENAIRTHVDDGRLELGNLVISDKYPLDIYLGDTRLASFDRENEYFYQEKGLYYFDVYNYALDNDRVGLTNMSNLRIKFFYTEDK